MTNKRKHIKTKRMQPRPKVKKQKVEARQRIGMDDPDIKKFEKYASAVSNMLKDKEVIQNRIYKAIDWVEDCFKRYDTVQLLSSVGLYLLNNLPNLESFFIAQIEGHNIELDEDAEVIAEYAMNFGLAMPNEGKTTPTDEIVEQLRETLRWLSKIFSLMEMPLDDEAGRMIEWMIHMDTTIVRGEGYQVHMMDLFNGMFEPHSNFYKEKYGFSFVEMRDFFADVENRIICKIGSHDSICGRYQMWQRWKDWEDAHKTNDEDSMNRDFSKGLFGEFFESNPDGPHSPDGNNFFLYQPDDYTGAGKIFWVYPQNDVEEKILETLSQSYGSNDKFLTGEYRGNIMNGYDILDRPFIMDGGQYYCFTPMIVHRNIFLIAEALMKRDDAYYQKHFQQNKLPQSRDQYIERKVKSVLEKFLPTVTFYSSIHYTTKDEEVNKKTELDILGISDKATYLVEVKAHELSYKDKVGIQGTRDKFEHSIGEGCYQSWRAERHIKTEDSKFGKIVIDKTKPIYKIVVTLQRYSALLGHYNYLEKAGWLDARYKDTWIVCLLDLMVFADFIESEDEFIEYLEMHKLIYEKDCMYQDEVDLLSQFLNNNLAERVRRNNNLMIIGGSEVIDAEYAKDCQLPIKN